MYLWSIFERSMGCSQGKVDVEEEGRRAPSAGDTVSNQSGAIRQSEVAPKVTHDVMVSYTHADATFTRLLVRTLRDAGLSVWIDEEALKGGVRSLEEIGKAVCTCKCMVPVLSAQRTGSKWCSDELGLAYTARKVMYPVTCDPFNAITLSYADKLILNGVQWENAAGSDAEARLQVLVAKIKRELASAAKGGNGGSSQNLDQGPFWPRHFGEAVSVRWDEFSAAFEADAVANGGAAWSSLAVLSPGGARQSERAANCPRRCPLHRPKQRAHLAAFLGPLQAAYPASPSPRTRCGRPSCRG